MNQDKFLQIIELHHQAIMKLCKEKNALQAKIDSLMLEFCSEEMTKEQIENWKQHQVVSTHSTKDNINDLL